MHKIGTVYKSSMLLKCYWFEITHDEQASVPNPL